MPFPNSKLLLKSKNLGEEVERERYQRSFKRWIRMERLSCVAIARALKIT